MKNQKRISQIILVILTFVGTVVAYKATDLLIQQMFANAGGYDYKVHSMYAQQMLNTDIDTIIINLQGLGLNHGISYPVWHLLFLLVEKVQSIRLGIACNISTVSAATTGIFEVIAYLVTVYLLCRYSTWKRHCGLCRLFLACCLLWDRYLFRHLLIIIIWGSLIRMYGIIQRRLQ